jgi:hypothetical protein
MHSGRCPRSFNLNGEALLAALGSFNLNGEASLAALASFNLNGKGYGRAHGKRTGSPQRSEENAYRKRSKREQTLSV